MINKKTLLIVSGTASIGMFIWSYLGNYRVCDSLMGGGSVGNCPFILTEIGINLFPVIPLFILSLITYKMRDDIYQAWLRFARVWIPLSMVLILLAPEYSGDWMFPVTKGSVAFSSSLLFVIISLILIAWEWSAPHRRLIK